MPKMKEGWIPKEERTHLTCKECKEELPRSEFVSEGTAPSGFKRYSARCKTCYTKHSRKYWNRSQLFEYVETVKVECERCEYKTCNAALEFHHKDPSKKDGAISEMIRNRRSLKSVKREIEKCVVLCANCHRELHHDVWSIEEING